MALGVLMLAGGCGYHVASGAGDALGPFTVVGGEVTAPEAGVMAAAEAGARAALAREGALARGGEGKAEVVVEVLRVEETSEGIAIAAGARDPKDVGARGIRVTVTGRARVRQGGEVARDTGDVRVSEGMAAAGDAAAAVMMREQAAERAARRLGETLARRVLGVPEPGER